MNKRAILRVLIAVALAAIGITYTGFVVSGRIPESQQLSATHLLMLAVLSVVVTLLVAPQSLRRLKVLELSGFKLELLERVRERQLRQSETLENISLILPLLLPETERVHLVKLLNGAASNYTGGGTLRNELRRLRSIALIRMTGKGYVADLTNDRGFDLSRYVELTELGKRWAIQSSSLANSKDKDNEDTTRST